MNDTDEIRRRLFEGLQDRDEHVLAALDGASIDYLLPILDERAPEHLCLFRGELAPELRAVSPHLVEVEPDSALPQYILPGWGRH
ncbi:MAG: DUF4123 domain-containing protein [Gammaproteobacteria bacterium]